VYEYDIGPSKVDFSVSIFSAWLYFSRLTKVGVRWWKHQCCKKVEIVS
jgi:hypothetical protein